MIYQFFFIPIFLCWGSFLNVVAYRLMSFDIPFFHSRSRCTHCKNLIAWYDNIPLISYFMLSAQCRHCKRVISWLYPFIEAITALSFLLLTKFTFPAYWPAYMIFFSALIISIRTDLETLLISRFASLWLIPFAFVFACFGWLPITLQESLIGSISAYLCLFSIAQIYYLITKRVGMGQGDVELLATIGAFTGFIGWWLTLLIASCLGSVIGIGLMILKRRSLVSIKIPFGPFLACGAMFVVLFQKYLIQFLIKF